MKRITRQRNGQTVLIFELHEPVTEYMAEVDAAPASCELISEIFKHDDRPF